MSDVVPAPPTARIAVRGEGPDSGTFPVHRIYCVGRNFADHAREMGAQAPATKSERGRPVFFLKPRDAPPGEVAAADAMALVFGYGVGLDLTRRDLQAEAKARGLPWDIGKAFDASAPLSEIVPAPAAGDLSTRTLSLEVNGELRQHGALSDLVWDVADILHELSKLYALRAGDLVFMGTPAGVGPLQPGDTFRAALDGVVEFRGRIAPPVMPL
jgi:2-keto-4-pentenoate hydratase/2-oxohepta-3-ene-1,7-dioic acid hydratase in catechol pathway